MLFYVLLYVCIFVLCVNFKGHHFTVGQLSITIITVIIAMMINRHVAIFDLEAMVF